MEAPKDISVHSMQDGKSFLDGIEEISSEALKGFPVKTISESYVDVLEELPNNLTKLSPIEIQIVQHAAANKTPKAIAISLGLPTSAVSRTLANKDVEGYLDSLVKARNKAIEAYLPGLLMDIVEAKVEMIQNDPERSLAELSKRDIVDIAKILSEMTQKSQVSDNTKTDGITNFYQQLNMIANSNPTT